MILPSCFSLRSGADFNYRIPGPDAYAVMLNNSSDHVLIEVRTPAEHGRSQLYGAVNYSFRSLKIGRMDQQLHRKELAFMNCAACHSSPLAV